MAEYEVVVWSDEKEEIGNRRLITKNTPTREKCNEIRAIIEASKNPLIQPSKEDLIRVRRHIVICGKCSHLKVD